MKKPNPKLYGWEESTPWDEGGWTIEGGEDAYSHALDAYNDAVNAAASEGLSEEPFYCLDEGDGKPRCDVQCPYCEKGL